MVQKEKDYGQQRNATKATAGKANEPSTAAKFSRRITANATTSNIDR
jgi:hypothetical protein